MKLYQMMNLIADWSDDDLMPDVTGYFAQHSNDAMDKLEKQFTLTELGAFFGAFGLFTNLIHLYGVPDDLDELYPATQEKP